MPKPTPSSLKIFRTLTLSLLLICTLLLSLSSGYIHFFAKKHIIILLQKHIDPDITFDDISYSFPFGISLLHIQSSSISMEKMYVYLSPLSIFSKHIRIRTITLKKPDYSINPSARSVNPVPPEKTAVSSNNLPSLKALHIEKIHIEHGKLSVGDYTVEDINGHINHIQLPLIDKQMDFALRAHFQHPLWTSGAQTHGWINWQDKSMHAAALFYQDQTMNQIQFNLTAEQNILNVEGHIQLADAFLDAHLTDHPLLQTLVTSPSLEADTRLESHFSFQTVLDRPRIEKIQFHGDITAEEPDYESDMAE